MNYIDKSNSISVDLNKIKNLNLIKFNKNHFSDKKEKEQEKKSEEENKKENKSKQSDEEPKNDPNDNKDKDDKSIYQFLINSNI